MEIGDGGGDSLRRRSKESRSHLRDFIQLKQQEEEEEVARRNSLTGLTLGDVLGGEPHRPTPTPTPTPMLPVQSNRTLLDIIQEEEEDLNSSSRRYKQQKNKTSWKALTEKLRLSLTITATVHIPNPNHRSTRSTSSQNQSIGLLIPSSLNNNNNNQLDLVGRESLSDLLLRSTTSSSSSSVTNGELNSVVQSNQQLTLVNSSENAQEVGMSLMALLEGGENGGGETEPDDVGISLMALLEETDRELGLEEEEEEEEIEVMENEIGGGGGGGGVDSISMNNMRCCICMVRQKGAAFIPCGHAFCRICSRELWVQRGTCPLCNASILEILHIF